MVVVVVVIAAAVVLVAIAVFARRRSLDRPPRTTPSPTPTLESAAAGVEPGRSRQCPRCGRHTVEVRDRAYECSWCRHSWQVEAGRSWPDVCLCLWIPPVSTSDSKQEL